MTVIPDPLARYRDALSRIPPPGCGCHGALLSVANRGALAGVDPHQMFDDIRGTIPPGNRHVPDKEILQAITKALVDHQGGSFTPRPRPQPVARDGKAVLATIIDQAQIHDEVDLWEASPVRLWGAGHEDAVLLLETLYDPTDLIFIGERYAPASWGPRSEPPETGLCTSAAAARPHRTSFRILWTASHARKRQATA